MDYGVKNEINAVATLVSKVLPVYAPSLKFVEEGCYRLTYGTATMIVSPDGSCRTSPGEQAQSAVEIKCPFPGKTYTTPVAYTLPKYYVPQVLAEMKATDTNKLYFISYSSESTTVQTVHFSESVWEAIEDEVISIYDHENPSRPTRRSPRVDELRKKINDFVSDNVEFIAEVPSVKATECTHNTSTESVFCSHANETMASSHMLEDVKATFHESKCLLDNAYSLSRTRATEFLGFMISDIDREYHFEMLHYVPIAYALKGYSMSTNVLRTMLETVLGECKKRDLYVPVCSFDGQWYKLVVRDRDEQPLTVHQLQKDVYSEVRKISKSDLVNRISQANVVNSNNLTELSTQVCIEKTGNTLSVSGVKSNRVIGLSRNAYEMIKGKETVQLHTYLGEQTPTSDQDIDELLTCVPDSLFQQLSEEIVDAVTQTATNSTSVDTSTRLTEDVVDTFTNESITTLLEQRDTRTELITTLEECPGVMDTSEQPSGENDEDIFHMLSALRNDPKANQNGQWNLSIEQFSQNLANAEVINKGFNLNQLKLMIKPIIGKLKGKGTKVNISSPKYVIVNVLSSTFGDGTNVQSKQRRRRNIASLKTLSKHALQSVRKEHLNVIYAEHIFPSKLQKWYESSPYGNEVNITTIKCENQKWWYSKPELNEPLGYYLFMILDAYHQLCGARRLLCGKGIPAAGVFRQPVHYIAEHSDANGCGLSLALVKDMIDKQSVAYAIQTFSEDVESALNAIDATQEAAFCRLIRNWYNAEDEPSIPAQTRCRYRLELREWLLANVNFGRFPPNGAYVKDIPIVLYEGLLTGIERRLQLFPMTKSGSYNVRAIGSLDIENFFGSFQDIDPCGTGVLRPDSIATALSVAVELTDTRMDPNRGFYMQTSKARVYPCNQYSGDTNSSNDDVSSEPKMDQFVRDVSRICVRDHTFDLSERTRGKQKRKRGTVSKPNEPARRPLPVREFHRAHESKILPHIRRGLALDQL